VAAGAGTTLRYALLQKLRPTSWVAVAYDRHYPMLPNYWVIPCRSEHLKFESLISS
jgi:hypothetical protein